MTTDPLTSLVVDANEMDRQRIAAALAGLVAIDGKTGRVITLPGFLSLSAEIKVVAYLLGRRTAVLLALSESDEASPGDITSDTGVPGGTIRRVLSELSSARRLDKVKSGRYRLADHQISAAIEGVENSEPRPQRGDWKSPRKKGSSSPAFPKTAVRKSRQSAPRLLGNLDLAPSDQPSFADFANEKKPQSHPDKQAVIVFYLKRYTSTQTVTLDHVYTCYVDQGWRRPADLANSLQVTRVRTGWLDTRSMHDIGLTLRGENRVEQDLPKQKAGR